MATISERKTSTGTISYTGQIRIKRKGSIVYSEAFTNGKKPIVERWVKKREAELAEPGALERAISGSPGNGNLLPVLIDSYIEEFRSLAAWKRSKQSHLLLLKKLLPQLDVTIMSSADLVAHVRRRRLAGAGPATVNNDIIWLRILCKTARGAWGIDANLEAIEDATAVCRSLRLIGRSKNRERRPTPGELERLDDYMAGGNKRKTPHRELLWFAIHSGRREEEICSLLRSDLNREHHTIIVRNMKNPDGSDGNDVLVKLTREAMAIIEAQPEISGEDRIFPYNHRTVGGYFTKACHVLGIEDLHFHDMRHEALSRLFEAGYDIHQVAQFSGHRSWATLKRYVQLHPKNLKLR
jgi:integrase